MILSPDQQRRDVALDYTGGSVAIICLVVQLSGRGVGAWRRGRTPFLFYRQSLFLLELNATLVQWVLAKGCRTRADETGAEINWACSRPNIAEVSRDPQRRHHKSARKTPVLARLARTVMACVGSSQFGHALRYVPMREAERSFSSPEVRRPLGIGAWLFKLILSRYIAPLLPCDGRRTKIISGVCEASSGGTRVEREMCRIHSYWSVSSERGRVP